MLCSVVYVLYERKEHPIFCPVTMFLALAFADGAFRDEGIRTPEDLRAIRIPAFKETLEVKWRQEILDTPIFRRTQDGAISLTAPFRPGDLNYYLKRLGKLAGYPQQLTSYALRRGAAAAVDCK